MEGHQREWIDRAMLPWHIYPSIIWDHPGHASPLPDHPAGVTLFSVEFVEQKPTKCCLFRLRHCPSQICSLPSPQPQSFG